MDNNNNKQNKQIVNKIQSEIDIIKAITDGIDINTFLADEKIKRAVCMTLINIGELVKGLSVELRESNPKIPWKDIAGFRDVAAHGYFTLRMPDVWTFVETEFPMYTIHIKDMLNK